MASDFVVVRSRGSSAYMSTPAVKSPDTLFLSFLLPVSPFLLFDRAAGFLPPRPRIVAGRRAQMLSRLAASSAATTLRGARPLQQSSTTAGLMGRGRLHSCLLFICL